MQLDINTGGAIPAPPIKSAPLFFLVEIAPLATSHFAVTITSTHVADSDDGFECINEDIATGIVVSTLSDAVNAIRNHLEQRT